MSIKSWLLVAFVVTCILGTVNVWVLMFAKGSLVNVFGAICCFATAFWLFGLWMER